MLNVRELHAYYGKSHILHGVHFGIGNFTTSPTTCPAAAGGCLTSIGGQFFGLNAAFTSIVFKTALPGGVSLNGAALGQR